MHTPVRHPSRSETWTSPLLNVERAHKSEVLVNATYMTHVKRIRAAFVLAIGAASIASAQTQVTRADVDRWAAAWNSHDIDQAMALFAPTVLIDQPENPRPLDFNGARTFFSMIFRAYPNFHVDVKQAVIEGLTAVSIEQVTGTWSGPFVDPATGASTPGNHRTFDHPGAMLIQYAPDHQITHVSIYWDQLIVDRQLGITPK
jgi:steroid delta-isomerase-like uncharacterized protein